jgi:hypothetical protein
MSIRKAMALAGLALVTVLVAVPVAMSAEGDDPVSAHTYVIRTVEDPSVGLLPASECPNAVGQVLRPAGYAWSFATRGSDGMVIHEQTQQVGVVRTCAVVTSLAEGATAPFSAEFDLVGGRYTALGSCRVTSNGVPQAGVVLAGCALRLLTGPEGFVGGIGTSASVLALPGSGFETGSFWTLRVYSSN